jgi:hypothetical protein
LRESAGLEKGFRLDYFFLGIFSGFSTPGVSVMVCSMDAAEEPKPIFWGTRKPYLKLKKETFEHIEAARLTAERDWNFKQVAQHFGRSEVWASNLFRQPFFQLRTLEFLKGRIHDSYERWRMIDREHAMVKKANYLRAASRRPRDSLGRFCG